MSGLRKIVPVNMAGIVPAPLDGQGFEIRLVDPRTLSVDERYQRQLSEKSMRLIRRIVAEFSWGAFKPPIVSEVDGALLVIDGQHTAIGAASHPGVGSIPVLIVRTDGTRGQAESFLRHNRDRVAMTPMQIHRAAVVAGDEIAVAVDEACARAEVRVLNSPPAFGIYKPGDTVAVGALQSLLKRRGTTFAVRVLTVARMAELAPVGSGAVKAIEVLLTDDEWKDNILPEVLAATIAGRSSADWEVVAETTVRKGRKMPMWQAVAIVWGRAAPKRRARA